MESGSPSSPGRSAALLALVIIAPIQLIGTTTAMVWFPDSTAAKVGFGIAKVMLMLAPLVWLWKVEKTRPRLPRWHGDPDGGLHGFRGSGMLAAHVTGALIFAVIAGAYYGFARHWIDVEPMREKVVQMGLDNLWLFLAGALYWCTINSLLEEYFWRWFIYSRLRDVLPRSAVGVGLAVVACGLLFTAHHVVALKVYFDWKTTILASAGVFIGGVTWSLLYLRYKNIWACYVSHVYPDVIIFFIGWQLIFGS
ncbi:MAG: CPBP family intramembrane glutamic endopeptidase [Planctomycetota bacterium]